MPNQTALEEIRVLIESHKVSYAFLNCGNPNHVVFLSHLHSYTVFSYTNAYCDIEASLGNMPLKAPIELLVVNGNLCTNYLPPISFSS